MTGLFDSIAGAKVYDLAQPYFVGMPHFPTHPPFLFSLTRVHGDYPGPEGHSSSAEAIGLGGHVGTHIDALCHFSYRGKLHGGLAISQSYSSGHGELTVDTIAPILRRALLLDIAGLQKVAALPDDFEVTAEELDRASSGLEIRRGDVVLLRTGWAAYFTETRLFLAEGRGPGPSLEGAKWLSARGVFATGSDTLAFEKIPSPTMPVHVHLLVEAGIHIVECLNLEELARAGVREFLLVAAPLKFRGATGAPLRPLALVAP
ncbi:MAG: cyclase family protein [Acidobacteriota bacterium]|jgi:kynurenine formamidase|nr:cyclase family protein [Acidobacteriota bacterium]